MVIIACSLPMYPVLTMVVRACCSSVRANLAWPTARYVALPHLQNSSILIQNSSFLIHNSLFLIQNHHFYSLGEAEDDGVLTLLERLLEDELQARSISFSVYIHQFGYKSMSVNRTLTLIGVGAAVNTRSGSFLRVKTDRNQSRTSSRKLLENQSKNTP